jgi:hypothetical protein
MKELSNVLHKCSVGTAGPIDELVGHVTSGY